MYQIHQLALYMHIVAGSCGLLLFWVPMITRKGSINHRRFGRYFSRVMYTVALTGLLMAGLDLYQPLLMHAVVVGSSVVGDAGTGAEAVRIRALFLLCLSILVLATTRHGWLVILHKEDRSVLRKPAHIVLCTLLLAAGVVLLLTGLAQRDPVFLAFGTLEIWLASNFLHYIFKQHMQPREWWRAHLGGLIGSGIGAYTAFFVFGGSSLFAQFFQGNLTVFNAVLWLAPGVVGGIAIARYSRHYERKFKAQAAGIQSR